MKLSDWTVIQYKDEPFHRYIYGDIDKYKQEECDSNEEFDIITFDQWTVDDCISLIDNLLEDINKHSISDITNIIKNAMYSINMSSKNQQKFMQNFTVQIFERYSY